MNEHIKNATDYAFSDNIADMTKELENALQYKIINALEQQKIAIAQSLMNTNESYEEELEEEYSDMSHAAKELVLHADNDQHLYHSSHVPIMNNLSKKMKSGKYEPEKATKLWAYHSDRAAQSYAKSHGDGTPWHKMFSPKDRKQAAAHWEDMHRHELNEELCGDKHKIDVNKDGKISSHDFKILKRKKVQKEAYIEEVLKVSDGVDAWIHDFVHSENPKFEGKSKKERIQMALGAFYAAKKETNESWDDEDDDADVRKADAELKKMKAKPIKAAKGVDPDKDISKLANKEPKEVEND